MRNLLLVIALTVLIGFSFVLSACKKDTQVIATVGEKKITRTILNEKLSTISVEYQKNTKRTLGKKQFIDAIVRETIIIEAAKKAGVEKQTEYKNAVNSFKTKQDKLFNNYKDYLLVEMYMNKICDSIKPNDRDVQKYHDKNRKLFDNSIGYKVKHILIYDLQTAQKVYSKLQKGESFDKVAKEVSQDSVSASNGGLIGPFRIGDLCPEFEQAVLKLLNNEMSEIIETPYGYHIILKISEQKVSPISFDETKEKIKKRLIKERFDAWFAQKRKELAVKISYDAWV